MPARESESIVLRTYPFREADLIVSFLTRDQGKLRGAARRARRPKSGFGSGLERLSHVKMFYFQRENRELVSLNSCEIIHSCFSLSDYPATVVMDYMAEVSEQILPAGEANERHFRLLLAVLDYLRSQQSTDGLWPAVTYFTLWAARLGGFLPDLPVSSESRSIAGEMFTTPIAHLSGQDWSKNTAADLRRFLVSVIQSHIERKLVTVPHLEAL
jgi:DNA repair protein RecO (recombination protein O)